MEKCGLAKFANFVYICITRGKRYHFCDNFSLKMETFARVIQIPADLTVSKRPGNNYRIEIRFAVFSRLYLVFSFIKLVETW